MENIIRMIRDANPERSPATLFRRMFKLTEEFGEHAEAYLNVTSKNNGKGKTWDDVREEIADSLIVAIDVALTPPIMDIGVNEVEHLLFNISYAPIPYSDYETSMLGVSSLIGTLSIIVRDGRGDILPIVDLVELISGMAITALPDQEGLSTDVLLKNLEHMIDTKLTKWKTNRLTGMNASDS